GRSHAISSITLCDFGSAQVGSRSRNELHSTHGLPDQKTKNVHLAPKCSCCLIGTCNFSFFWQPFCSPNFPEEAGQRLGTRPWVKEEHGYEVDELVARCRHWRGLVCIPHCNGLFARSARRGGWRAGSPVP